MPITNFAVIGSQEKSPRKPQRSGAGSSVDEGQRPSHGPRCGHQYDRGCEHQTQQTEEEQMLAHVGALSTKAKVGGGKSVTRSAQPNRGPP
jgi:hypothetical protein